METRTKSFLNQFLIVSLALAAFFLVENRAERGRSYWAVAALVPVLALGVFLIKRLLGKTEKLKLTIPRWLAYGLSALLQLGLLAVLLTQDFQLVNSTVGRLLLAVLAAGGAALLFLATKDASSPQRSFITALLVFGALYRVAAFLPELQPGPFALGWSEGSRFYNASLFLSERIYGQKLPLPVLHPSRYLLQAFPFLLGIKSILAHRIWQVLLWLGMSAWGAYLFARRLGKGKDIPIWLLTIWAALFFFQGAVYYHLMVCVILVLLGYRKDKIWRTLFFVILASLWAGISRVNWMPLPGLLAGVLYLLDQPLEKKNGFDIWPRQRCGLCWVLGLPGLRSRVTFESPVRTPRCSILLQFRADLESPAAQSDFRAGHSAGNFAGLPARLGLLAQRPGKADACAELAALAGSHRNSGGVLPGRRTGQLENRRWRRPA
jgi:hypothetical protein